jgi:DNA-binding transcriptional LysR family regulator
MAAKACAPTAAPAWLLAPLTSIIASPRAVLPVGGSAARVSGLNVVSVMAASVGVSLASREMLRTTRRYALCMDLDTRHLRALVAVADEGTFTDAAITLRTSQASISRSVQRLEAVVGHRLLSRTTRHVETTPTGERVLVHARRILRVLEQLESVAAPSSADLLVGYAWAALGEHTVAVQRSWEEAQTRALVFVQSNTPTAGLLEGRCEVSVVRRPVTGPGLESAVVGTERRYAALAADHPLAGRTSLRLADFADLIVAVDAETGTTSEELWNADARPAGFRTTHGVDEWLTLIASGRAAGISSEATAAQHPRPGVAYSLLEDAPPISVWLAWWRDSPASALHAFIEISRAAYTSGT